MPNDTNVDPASPFGAGPLDGHQITDIAAQLPESIAVLSDADAERHLAGIEEAIKQKRALGQVREALSMVLSLAKPFLPI